MGLRRRDWALRKKGFLGQPKTKTGPGRGSGEEGVNDPKGWPHKNQAEAAKKFETEKESLWVREENKMPNLTGGTQDGAQKKDRQSGSSPGEGPQWDENLKK